MRVNVVIRYIGLVLQFVAAFMLLSAVVSMLNGYDSAYYPLLLSSFMTAPWAHSHSSSWSVSTRLRPRRVMPSS